MCIEIEIDDSEIYEDDNANDENTSESEDEE